MFPPDPTNTPSHTGHFNRHRVLIKCFHGSSFNFPLCRDVVLAATLRCEFLSDSSTRVRTKIAALLNLLVIVKEDLSGGPLLAESSAFFFSFLWHVEKFFFFFVRRETPADLEKRLQNVQVENASGII